MCDYGFFSVHDYHSNGMFTSCIPKQQPGGGGIGLAGLQQAVGQVLAWAMALDHEDTLPDMSESGFPESIIYLERVMPNIHCSSSQTLSRMLGVVGG